MTPVDAPVFKTPVFPAAPDAARALDAEHPTLLRRPHVAARLARRHVTTFPGAVYYAAKANPEPWLLQILRAEGVAGFDVASAAEIDAVHAACPGAPCIFMHPIKPVSAIERAYVDAGCRVFAFDHADELAKIRQATHGAGDVALVVRLEVSNAGAALPLTKKFGAPPAEAAALLRTALPWAGRLGVSFHVGSQNHRPEAFTAAYAAVIAMADALGAPLDIIDVGGGFPELYPGMATPPPLDAFFTAIGRAHADAPPACRQAQLWCEPGRSLVANAVSLLTTVELRKGGVLHINDGGAGALFDAVRSDWRYPARVLREGRVLTGPHRAFTVYGPTCDSDDVLAHPVALPHDVRTGDSLEFGQLGAYGAAMASPFNGFGRYAHAVVQDDPWPSLALNPAALDAIR